MTLPIDAEIKLVIILLQKIDISNDSQGLFLQGYFLYRNPVVVGCRGDYVRYKIWE